MISINDIGYLNLFYSHFVIGCRILSNEDLSKKVHDFIKLMENDHHMHEHLRQLYTLDYLHIIELKDLESIFNDLKRLYKLKYPYSKEVDFYNTVFDYTVCLLNRLISRYEQNDITFYSLYNDLEIYSYYENYSRQFYIIKNDSKGLDYYIQYYKRALELIESYKTPLQTNDENNNQSSSNASLDLSNKKDTKSLMLHGRKLNLSERYKIANKVLNIDKTIRQLNIQDLEKYQLLAFILGCDKDNARNIMNGTYKSKDRDLDEYLDELGLNK